MKAALGGDLDRIVRARVGGFVNAVPDFTDHQVINSA
jgi:hypothetical protein